MTAVGTRVRYTLNAEDAEQINERRVDHAAFLKMNGRERQGEAARTGHQGHVGNPAAEGDVFPGVVVAVFGTAGTTANLQVFLDGNDAHWATSRQLGDGPGSYQLA